VEGPGNFSYELYDDNTHCDGYTGDGRYQHCMGVEDPEPGIYTFNVKDNDNNKVYKSNDLPIILACPNITSLHHNEFVSDPDFEITWNPVEGADYYSIWIDRDDWGQVWSIGIDASTTSVNYNYNNNGYNLLEGKTYRLQIGARDENDNWSYSRLRFAYAPSNVIDIDGQMDSWWYGADGYIHIGEDQLVWGEIDDEGDCSANVYLAYDSLFLYGMIDVTDDIMGDHYDWWWENDAFKLVFDTDPNSLASEQDRDDRLYIQYTARDHIDDTRNGRNPNLYYRKETNYGYIIEFAVSKDALINTSPDPDESIILKEGTELGFLFGLSDEDDVNGERGNDAVFIWGHASARSNAEDNLTMYGSMILTDNNQIELSQTNLVMPADTPYISNARLNFHHYLEENEEERWGFHFDLYLNDAQGLDDIESVWVEFPGGGDTLLYDDNTHCDGEPGDGNYQHCIDFDYEVPTGDYTFYAVDSSENKATWVETLENIDRPEIIWPLNNSIISEQNILLDWIEVQDIGDHWIDMAYLDENNNHNWFWHQHINSGNNIDSFYYNGQDFESNHAYLFQVSANNVWTRVKFTYRESDRHIVYVDINNNTGTENGSLEYPFTSIQTAINATIPGDTVLVYPGTYYENIQIYNKNIVLASKYLTTDSAHYINETVIDGSQNTTVLYINNCEIEVIGFTIQNGMNQEGAGIDIHNSFAIFDHLVITENTAHNEGGGIRFGGGIDVIIKNSVLSNNSAGNDGGAIENCCENIIIENCKFISNSANRGGAILSHGQCDIKNSLISNNNSDAITGRNFQIYNSTIINNQNNAFGLWENCVLRNCIIWNNSDNYGFDDIQYSLIEGGYSGTGNINTDPLFIDPDNEDYHLQKSSPCINTGTPDTSGLNIPATDLDGNPRIYEGRIDMGAYEATDTFIIPANTIYVNIQNTTGIEDGTADHPYNTIQEGIEASQDGIIVLVYPGTYYENINIDNKNIVLASLYLYSNDTNDISRTVIDGNQNGSVII
ncbi:sugar-binding protein, partial [Bacteroidota bacterium]